MSPDLLSRAIPLLLLCLACPTSAQEVSARLDADQVRLGETLILTLESDGQMEAGPDLTPLQRDFHIVARSSSRQISEVNGRRQEHQELRLTLSPRYSGRLEIPAIAFGEVVTRPLGVNVEAGEGAGTNTLSQTQAPSLPYAAPPVPARSPVVTPSPPSLPVRPSAPLPTAIPSSQSLPATETPSQSLPVTVPPAQVLVEPPRSPPWPGLPSGGWSGLLLVVLGLMAWWWRGRLRPGGGSLRPPDHSGQAPESPGSGPSPTPRDPIATAIAEVQRAYTEGVAADAREALLAWAALVLPDRPPGNLALLAQRCQEPLRSEILILEQAFFSPRPLPWDRHPVWERLANFVPLPPAEPASFRQKRPLRATRSGREET